MTGLTDYAQYRLTQLLDELSQLDLERTLREHNHLHHLAYAAAYGVMETRIRNLQSLAVMLRSELDRTAREPADA
jgi:hypothetical protein